MYVNFFKSKKIKRYAHLLTKKLIFGARRVTHSLFYPFDKTIENFFNRLILAVKPKILILSDRELKIKVDVTLLKFLIWTIGASTKFNPKKLKFFLASV